MAARPVSETNMTMKLINSTDAMAKAMLIDDNLNTRTANVTPVAIQVTASHRVVWKTAA